MAEKDFEERFEALTGNRPFPWQRELYRRFVSGEFPASCNLPTGLGKTSIIAIWLLAWQSAPAHVSRRLVYVVNRRTVVDQTTNEAMRLRETAKKIGIDNLAISTLRGQFADNREWSVDPSRPAVICGTVDMIGSRLLFCGYGVGFKSRPLHAGFLGQDVLLVHDEAHLEPAFQELGEQIEAEQTRERRGQNELPWPRMRVMALTATTRNGELQANGSFTLTSEEQNPPNEMPTASTESVHHVWRRLKARKLLSLHQIADEKDAVAKEIAKRAAAYAGANTAVLVFVRTLENVSIVEAELAKTGRSVVLLTGTMRGKERDTLVERLEFKRFLKGAEPGQTVYLVCTSAGEVGIDISAEHMVCDLSTFESMAQRLGRVHRYGDPVEHVAQIDVVHPQSFGKIDKKTGELKTDQFDKRRQKTLELLRRLPAIGDNRFDASPKSLGELRNRTDPPCNVHDAFAPEPVILPATDMLFDAWTLTSIRQPMPGRPPVDAYLHGIAEWQPPETRVAWRKEVEIVSGDFLALYPPVDLLEDYPLTPHELLRDATDRKNSGVFAQLSKIARRCPECIVWLVDAQGEVTPTKLQAVVAGDSRRLYDATVILPPSVGGLTSAGMLDGDKPCTEDVNYDVADIASSVGASRVRVWSGDADFKTKTAGMRRVRSIVLGDAEDDQATEPRRWEWFESLPLEGGRTAKQAVAWDTHVSDVVNHAKRIVAGLSLPQEIGDAVILAAKLHDQGKLRERFQLTLGNRDYPNTTLAKAGRNGARLPEPFRHEFASAIDAQEEPEFITLSAEMKDLVLHLIAAHHGRARPHFSIEEAVDLERSPAHADAMAVETPRRFARLQRKYGRWGLTYLESLLRAADWAASAEPSAYLEESEVNS